MASLIHLTKDEFRLLTSTRPELSEMTIQPELLEKNCPLDNGRLEQHTVSRSNLQSRLFDTVDLQSLPPDIINSILNSLDLRSLTDLRAVSWGTRALVDNLPQYKSINQHAPNALRALLSTKTAVYSTALDLFRTLSSQACINCGQFGPFLDLFTCDRYCLTCVSFSGTLLCAPLSAARRDYKLGLKIERQLQTYRTLPGKYTERKILYRRRYNLVRATEIRLMQRTTHGYKEPSPFEKAQTNQGNPYRYMSVLRIPALIPETGMVDWGVSCQSCHIRHENTLYSSDTYSEHFQQCQVSQVARREIPNYITNIPEDQPRLDCLFLRFLDRLR